MPSVGRSLREALQRVAGNPLPVAMDETDFVCAIIGETASTTARSPTVWNAAFRALGWNALFVPLDLQQARLSEFLNIARSAKGLRGFAVTMPFKIDVVGLLDKVDPLAARIGAVNTVAVRDGKLVGYNTDASGFLMSIARPLPGARAPFVAKLDGSRALLLGAGGAGRAVAFALGEVVGPSGSIIIANRSSTQGADLARAISAAGTLARAIDESRIGAEVAGFDIVVNASLKGQAGLRKVAGGVGTLEPYSALAPAVVEPIEAGADEAAVLAAWWARNHAHVAENHRASGAVFAALPTNAPVVDIVFAPTESVLLRQARLSGHRTLNGRAMNVSQAADAFLTKVLPAELAHAGLSAEKAFPTIFHSMSQA